MKPKTVLAISHDNMRLSAIAFARRHGFDVPDNARLVVSPAVGTTSYIQCLEWEQTMEPRRKV